MKNVLCVLVVFSQTLVMGQVVWTEPSFPTQQDDIKLFFDASQGNAGLEGYTGDVYAHMGLITNNSSSPTDWKYVQGTWGVEDDNVLMTREGPDLYSKSYNIESFHGVPPGELVEMLAFVFRSGDGSVAGRATDGSDIYLEVFPPTTGLLATLLAPEDNTIIYLGESFELELQVNKEASVVIYDNGEEIYSSITETVDLDVMGNSLGTHELRIVVTEGNDTEEIFRSYFVLENNDPREDRPGWLSEYGLTYRNGADAYGISLIAPDKEHVFLLCPANDFKVDLDYRMKKTMDGNGFWLEVDRTDLDNERNMYQFLVDGRIKVADPYSKVVLDPWNDEWVPEDVQEKYPPYPSGLTSGLVTTFDLDENIYDWDIIDFERPAKERLVIYEMMMRDFLEDKNYKSLLDTISYLSDLGINAIELMPIQEFEGNDSWGYNPSFHNAIDKYYGSEQQLQEVIDHCHKEGIAVIIDVVFNHAFSQSPLCQLYWDAAQFRPSPDNPWLNEVARHPFNVGYDFNHQSPFTQAWVKEVLRRMIQDLNVDGFRFDLSKGFTQVNSNGNASLMSRYDQSRIDILTEYADHIRMMDDDLYVILEHFADSDEEKELASKDMMLWSNTTFQFAEAAMGYSSDLTAASYKSRGFVSPSLIAYMESHDEERMGYKIKTWGNGTSDYDTKNPWVFSERIAATAAVYFSIPGPKMLWQFGELGYDYSINRCENGTISENCRLSPKPIRWDYVEKNYRKNIYDKLSAMLYLRNNHDVFHTPNFSLTDDPYFKRIKLNGQEMNALTLANFDVRDKTIQPQFQHTGIWYEYFSGEEFAVTDINADMLLRPGEYRIYTSKRITPPNGYLSSTAEIDIDAMAVYPNPVEAGAEIHLFSGAQQYRVMLHDELGRVYQLVPDCAAEDCRVTIPVGISSGVYFLHADDGNQRKAAKFVVQGER